MGRQQRCRVDPAAAAAAAAAAGVSALSRYACGGVRSSLLAELPGPATVGGC